MIDPVTKSGFLASTSMATIDESNAEDVHVLDNLKLNLEKNMLNGRLEYTTAAYCNESYGFVWKCWVNIPNEIAI